MDFAAGPLGHPADAAAPAQVVRIKNPVVALANACQVATALFVLPVEGQVAGQLGDADQAGGLAVKMAVERAVGGDSQVAALIRRDVIPGVAAHHAVGIANRQVEDLCVLRQLGILDERLDREAFAQGVDVGRQRRAGLIVGELIRRPRLPRSPRRIDAAERGEAGEPPNHALDQRADPRPVLRLRLIPAHQSPERAALVPSLVVIRLCAASTL